jgi:hypothetical protein
MKIIKPKFYLELIDDNKYINIYSHYDTQHLSDEKTVINVPCFEKYFSNLINKIPNKFLILDQNNINDIIKHINSINFINKTNYLYDLIETLIKIYNTLKYDYRRLPCNCIEQYNNEEWKKYKSCFEHYELSRY